MERDIRKITKRAIETTNNGFLVHSNRNSFGLGLGGSEIFLSYTDANLPMGIISTILVLAIITDSAISGIEEQKKTRRI